MRDRLTMCHNKAYFNFSLRLPTCPFFAASFLRCTSSSLTFLKESHNLGHHPSATLGQLVYCCCWYIRDRVREERRGRWQGYSINKHNKLYIITSEERCAHYNRPMSPLDILHSSFSKAIDKNFLLILLV